MQEAGLYKQWIHLHTLTPRGEGVLMTDTVRYRLPFGPIGRLIHSLAVRSMLSQVFDFRYTKINELFGGATAVTNPNA